jgi:hypothetical protein
MLALSELEIDSAGVQLFFDIVAQNLLDCPTFKFVVACAINGKLTTLSGLN